MLEAAVELGEGDTIPKVQAELAQKRSDGTLRAKEVKLLRNFYQDNHQLEGELKSLQQE